MDLRNYKEGDVKFEMIKRIIAIALVAGLSLQVQVGTVVAMDTTEGYRLWENYDEYTPQNQRYEDEEGIDMKEGELEDYSHFEDFSSEDTGEYPPLYDENGNIIDPVIPGAKEEPDSTDVPTEEPIEEPSEPAKPVEDEFNPEDYFVEDETYNNDFSFGDGFDFNPYNPGDFNFYDPSVGFGSSSGSYYDDVEEEKKEPGDDFLNTGKTIHYAYGEVDKYTKFIDTGIKVPASHEITYKQLNELFKRISIEQGWKMVEDANKLMLLRDGLITVVEGSAVTESTLREVFEETDITISFQDTRAGGKFTIADYLEAFEEIDVLIDGKPITLHSEPELVNSRALLPIRSIGEGLGATVTWDQGKNEAKITKGDTKIIYTMDKLTADVNGRTYLLTEKTKLNDENHRLLSVVNLLVNELGAKMHWNSNENVLIIESNKVDEKVNLDKNL